MRFQAAGLTLVEAILAVAIFLLGYLFLLETLTPSLQGIGKARNLNFAAQLAQQNLESYMAWYATTGGAGTGPNQGFGTTTLSAKVNGLPINTSFFWQVVVTPDPDPESVVPGPPPAYSLIHLVSWVRWPEPGENNARAPAGAPAHIMAGYGSHFLPVEIRVFCPVPCR